MSNGSRHMKRARKLIESRAQMLGRRFKGARRTVQALRIVNRQICLMLRRLPYATRFTLEPLVNVLNNLLSLSRKCDSGRPGGALGTTL